MLTLNFAANFSLVWGRRNSLGRIYGYLLRGFSCKEVKVAWASCRQYSSELLRSSRFCSSLSTAFSPPSQMETVALLVSVNGVHNCSAWLRGFLICKQLSKIMTFILSRFFRSFISTSTNSPKSLSYNAATKQCPVHVCQMYLPLSLSWSIFQWLASFSWLCSIQPGQQFCPKAARGNDKIHKVCMHAWPIKWYTFVNIHICCQIETANRNQRNRMEQRL